ncbi:MAG: hypothetical protein ACK58T_32935, partial [Phycisphaerae bacterium]
RDLAQDSGRRLNVDIGGPAPASHHDRLVVSGNASRAGVLELRLLDGFLPEVGAEFLFLTAAAITGNFSEVAAPVFGNGRTFKLVFGPGTIRAAVTPVPVPSAFWLAAGALVVVGRCRRHAAA